MKIKKCPVCGLPVPGLSVCPNCGASTDNGFPPKPKKPVLPLNKIKLGPWGLSIILIANTILLMVIANVVTGGAPWSCYPILAIVIGFFTALLIAANSTEQFLTRLRNSTIAINLTAILCAVFGAITAHSEFFWLIDYFVPTLIVVSSIVAVIFAVCGKASAAAVLIAVAGFFPQSAALFVAMIFRPDISFLAQKLFISVAFGINFLTAINLAAICATKGVNLIKETFRFWE